MPFKSQAQAKYLRAFKPDIAKEFASKTPSIKALPQRRSGGKYDKRGPAIPRLK